MSVSTAAVTLDPGTASDAADAAASVSQEALEAAANFSIFTAVSLLVGGFIGSIWLSSRIYRVGILMYGKKPRLKDIARWVRYA